VHNAIDNPEGGDSAQGNSCVGDYERHCALPLIHQQMTIILLKCTYDRLYGLTIASFAIPSCFQRIASEQNVDFENFGNWSTSGHPWHSSNDISAKSCRHQILLELFEHGHILFDVLKQMPIDIHRHGVKWSGKSGQCAKMYPTLMNGYENDEATELFRQV